MKYIDLGQLVKIQKGKKLDEVYVKSADTLRYIQIEDLRNDENIKYTSSDLKSAICDKNDILIAWDGANAGTIGFGLKGAIGSTLAKLTPTKEFFTPFVGRFLQSKFTYLRNSCTGATIPHISKSVLIKVQIPLPPLPEQKRIAEILDKADALRQKNKQLLATYDELLQATFLDMFGDPVTNPKEFRNIEFNEIISQGPTNGIYKPQCEYGEGNFILRIDTYNNGDLTYIDNLKRVKASVKELETYSLKKHDILINRVNSPSHLGKSTLVIGISEEAIFESNMMRIRIDHAVANPLFIIKVLSQPYLKGQILTRAKDAVNQSSINQEDVKGFTFYLPPISLQNQFAQIVENIEAQKTLVKQSFQESEDLFNGLVQKAFGGEL
jgi:type I restriction enzyme S subunit